MALADENRKRIAGEIETLKAKADAEAQAAMSAAEARIAATRTAALGNVKAAAGEAAAAIEAVLDHRCPELKCAFWGAVEKRYRLDTESCGRLPAEPSASLDARPPA